MGQTVIIPLKNAILESFFSRGQNSWFPLQPRPGGQESVTGALQLFFKFTSNDFPTGLVPVDVDHPALPFVDPVASRSPRFDEPARAYAPQPQPQHPHVAPAQAAVAPPYAPIAPAFAPAAPLMPIRAAQAPPAPVLPAYAPAAAAALPPPPPYSTDAHVPEEREGAPRGSYAPAAPAAPYSDFSRPPPPVSLDSRPPAYNPDY